ncbi:MAG: hypothetical protein ABI277_07915 [Burkholderiaceae bacterium]
MKAVLRATCMTALALVCLDGYAKAGCVTTLEAKSTRVETPAPTRRACIDTVGYVPQRSSKLRAASASDVAPPTMRHG